VKDTYHKVPPMKSSLLPRPS